MSASLQPAQKSKSTVDEVLNKAVVARTSTAATAEVAKKEDPFANIEANRIFQALLQGELSLEERRKAVAEIAAGVKDKATNRVLQRELAQFQAFIQAHRLAMNEEIIALTNTKVKGELKRVYDELNTSMLTFEDQIGPFVELVDALYRLRTHGKTFDVLRKIKAEREERQRHVLLRDRTQQEKDSDDRVARELRTLNAGLAEQKTFFGVGGIKESARVEIARNLDKIKELEARSEERAKSLADLDATISAQANVDGEFAIEEGHLRRMLSIDAEEHEREQEAIVKAAQAYVSMTKERTQAVMGHLGSVTEQIERLMDTNSNFSRIYAVLSDGVGDAIGLTKGRLAEVEAAPETGSLTDKMQRDEDVTTFNVHLGVLQEAAASTGEAFSELITEKARIKSMGDANADQLAEIGRYNSIGVAGIASRISTVMTALNEAALGEASGMLGENMREMIRSTNRIAQKGVIQNAMGIDDRNAEIEAAMEEVAGFGEVIRAATTLSRDGMAKLRSNLDRMSDLTKGLQSDIQDSFAVAGEAKGTGGDEAKPAPAAPKPSAYDFSKGI